jgi:ribonucleoside-diphosphate reductase alpha chain
MYFHAWKLGLKTTYYLRSRPASGVTKTTCPIDNTGSCEACQ